MKISETSEIVAVTKIAESFVDRENKRMEAGNGEMRLYLRQMYCDFDLFDFSPDYYFKAYNKIYLKSKLICLISKSDLMTYMMKAKQGYKELAELKKLNGNLEELYGKRINEISLLPEILRFEIFNQSSDNNRIYIGSKSPIWGLMRRISIPLNTYWMITREWDNHNQEYTLRFKIIYEEGNLDVLDDISVLTSASADALNKELEDRAHERMLENGDLSDTVRKAIIEARIGQGRFRNDVISKMPRCPFTGISDKNLLRASHCIPWAECISYYDRLDPYNGLALTPTYDLLFDRGYISFDKDGRVIISEILDDTVINALNLVPGKQILFADEHQLYLRDRFLRYHRENIFRGDLV